MSMGQGAVGLEVHPICFSFPFLDFWTSCFSLQRQSLSNKAKTMAVMVRLKYHRLYFLFFVSYPYNRQLHIDFHLVFLLFRTIKFGYKFLSIHIIVSYTKRPSIHTQISLFSLIQSPKNTKSISFSHFTHFFLINTILISSPT